MTMQRKLISIVAPFYNEGEGVGCFYTAISKILDQIPSVDFEVVCVDDGSRDDTKGAHLGALRLTDQISSLKYWDRVIFYVDQPEQK